MKFTQLCQELETKIQDSYLEGINMEAAEKLAGQLLYAQMVLSTELKKADMDARARKSGVKAIRAAIYLDIVGKSDKKPTETQIGSMIDTNELVQSEQNAYDVAEVEKDDLERYFDIFASAHVHFRTIAKGQFGA